MSKAPRKIGEGHLAAMGRLGHKELTHNLLPAFPHQGQHVIEEPGLWGNPTQGEVAQARQGPGAGAEQESYAAEQQPQQKYSLEDYRRLAKERAAQAERRWNKVTSVTRAKNDRRTPCARA